MLLFFIECVRLAMTFISIFTPSRLRPEAEYNTEMCVVNPAYNLHPSSQPTAATPPPSSTAEQDSEAYVLCKVQEEEP